MADSDYQAAAIAAMKSPEASGAPPAKVEAPAPSLDESKLVVEPPKEVAKVEPAKADDGPPKEVKSDSIRKSFETLAREKAELRQKAEEFRPLQQLQQRLGPQGIHELLRAEAAGDVVGILRALGVKPNEVQMPAEAEETPGPAKDPRFDALQKELAALRAERQAEKYSVGRKHTLERTANLAKAPEFELISDEPAAHDEALKMVEDYIKAHNEMPAETPEESLKLALAAVNERYLEEAAKWEKRLTKVKRPDKVVAVTESPAQSTPAESEVGKSRTLTNSLSSSTPPPPNSSPQSDEDYHRLAIAAMKNMPG